MREITVHHVVHFDPLQLKWILHALRAPGSATPEEQQQAARELSESVEKLRRATDGDPAT